MGKFGRTFNIDIQVLQWLEEHAKKNKRKVSYIVNAGLRQMMRQNQSWDCPECKANNDNQFTNCHKCDYVLSFKDL